MFKGEKRRSLTFFGIFLIVLVIFGGFMLLKKQDKAKAVMTDNIYGWAWSENFGWISLNCFNYYNSVLEDHCNTSILSPDCDGNNCVDYGVSVSSGTGFFSGYAWSEHNGWINFAPPGPYPDAPAYSAKLSNDGMITGWTQVVNLGSKGWINFRGKECSAPGANCDVNGPAPYALDSTPDDGQSSLCYNCYRYKKTCSSGINAGLACVSDDQCPGDPPGACNGNYILDSGGELMCSVCFSRHFPAVCQETGAPPCLNESKYGVGSVCAMDATIPKNSLYLCNNCQSFDNQNTNTTIVTCASCPKCYKYGVAVDYDRNRLIGWAWNNGSNGLGWIQYHATKAFVQGPWLETKLGGIYSGGSVGSAFTYSPPESKFNATYEIHSGGTIIHFSSKGGIDWTKESFENLDFPDESSVYTNALGRIDFSGIEAGQYGEVKNIFSAADIDNVLGGKVYIIDGDLTIDTTAVPLGLTFNPGNINIPDGSGTIVVQGNLYIKTDIKYSNGAIAKLKYLPSVAWIVKGDVIVEPSVNQIVGAFIIVGDGLPDVCPPLTEGSVGCGRFSSGLSGNSLYVSGLMMAKQFNLQRSYFSLNKGAEEVLYDGRVIVNTPPGLQDISLVLPVWKEIAP